METRNYITIMAALGMLGAVAFTAQHTATADSITGSGKDCTVVSDQDDINYPNGIRQAVSLFNAKDITFQGCSKAITITKDIILAQPLVFSGATSKENHLKIVGQVTSGKAPTIFAAGAQKDGCAIIIKSSYVDVEDLVVNGGTICVGDPKATQVTSNVTFENVVMDHSSGDGIRVEAMTNTVSIGKSCRIQQSTGHGINFVGPMEGKGHNIYYALNNVKDAKGNNVKDEKGLDKLIADPYSVSLFQNANNDKSLELKTGSSADFEIIESSVAATTNTVYGDIKLPQGKKLAKGTRIIAFRAKGGVVYDKDGNELQSDTTFLGEVELKATHFILKTSKTLTGQKDEYIVLVPVWSKAQNNASAVFGSSTNKIQVKLTAGGSDSNGGGSGGTSSSSSDYSSIKLPDGSTIPVLNGVVYGFKSVIECLAYLKGQADLTGITLEQVDSDGDGISDIKEDRNRNCTTDSGETNWNNADSDGDGILDGEEDQNRNGYQDCYRVCMGQDCDSDTTPDGIPTKIKIDTKDISLVQDVINPKTYDATKTSNTVKAVPFPVLIDENGVACSDGSKSDTCVMAQSNQDTQSFIGTDGRPKLFQKGRDFCVETNSVQLTGTDTDGDGLPDGYELRPSFYNPVIKAHLYLMFEAKKYLVNNQEQECDAGLTGRKAQSVPVIGKTTVFENGVSTEKDVTINLWMVCVSDSLAYNSIAFDINQPTSNGRTNPFSADSDGDLWCDGPAVSSGCIESKAIKGQDNCPLIKDDNNTCTKSCVPGQLFVGLPTEDVKNLKKYIGEFSDAINRSELVSKINNVYGKYGKNPDLDKDNIPDIVEDPDDVCNFDANDKYLTNPYLKDTDGDGMDDSIDPCPVNDKDNNCIKKAAVGSSTQCGSYIEGENYSSHRALYCFLDWDQDKLYNCEENSDFDNKIDAPSESCPLVADTDNDSLNDKLERDFKTSPWAKDTDSDGLDDIVEVNLDGNPNSLNVQFMTGTPACNAEQADGIAPLPVQDGHYLLKGDTDPTKKDTDGDGIPDGVEAPDGSGTNPLNPDSDGDGVCDGKSDVPGPGTIIKDGDTYICLAGEDLSEGKDYPHFPKNAADADNKDSLYNYMNPPGGFLVLDNGVHASNPCSKDTDHDNQLDSVDAVKNNPDKNATAPGKFGADRDNDGIPDSIEIGQLGINPDKADTDGDGLEDGCVYIGTLQMRGELCAHLMNNHPDFTNLGKGPGKDYNPNLGDTDPLNPDTDSDGMKDGDELAYPDKTLKSPYQKNEKGDLTFIGFYRNGVNLNPLTPDTDGDGILDGIEAGARFKNEGVGVCKDNFCCFLNGVEAVKAGGLDPGFTANATYVEGTTTNALLKDTDGDELQDGSKVTTFQPRNNWGEDLNCNGVADKDKDGNLKESNPLFADSNHDGISDKDAVCRNGICDPSINMPYVYARQAGTGCTNTLMPGETLPATAGDVATLLMMLTPLGMAVRMRIRRGLKK